LDSIYKKIPNWLVVKELVNKICGSYICVCKSSSEGKTTNL